LIGFIFPGYPTAGDIIRKYINLSILRCKKREEFLRSAVSAKDAKGFQYN
jgi:hypothetical protein